MPSDDRALRFLSRLLPRDFRDRVFEPALTDIRVDELTGTPHRFARLALVAECLRLGLPAWLWSRGRMTRAGVATLIVVAAITLAAARIRYAQARMAAGAWTAETR